ncbi:hypothetical protein ABEF95_003676 [Exophiala dermatitidis]
MEFRALDASSMSQIKRYTDAFKSAQEPKLDFLIMTQGILSADGRAETPEGIDRKMALHYYGRQLLIRELLPVLQNDAKVIVVLDGQRGDPNQLDWEDLDLKKHYSSRRAASHCISMNDAMVQYHAAQEQKQGKPRRHFVHAAPGLVNTNIFMGLPWYLRPIARVAGEIFGVPPSDCAQFLLGGVSECTAAGEKEGRFWSNIDSKGRLVENKAIWNEEQMRIVAQHTWNLVDGAIEGTPSSSI